MNKISDRKLCQCCVNSYGGKHGEVKKVLKNIKYIDIGKVEAHIGELGKNIVIVFRGSDSFEDWVDNLDFRKTDIGNGIKVHVGFWSQIEAITESIFHELNDRDTSKSIYITGHSLGGVLATLLSYKFWMLFKIKGCVTFGSPRVGNKKFQKVFNKRIKASRRYVNREDTICKVPTVWMGFKHVKNKVRIGQKLSWRERLLYVPRKIFGNPLDHYPQRYLKNLEK